MNRLRRVLILAVALLLVVVAGLSITLYAIQTRHSQIINEESRAVQRLEMTDRAALRLAEQREAVTSSILTPLDRHQFAQDTTIFQEVMSTPSLSNTSEGAQMQNAILQAQRQFSQAALRLPAHPSSSQVLVVHNMGDALAAQLRSFRTRHTVDLAALQISEAQQRRLSVLMIIVTNGIILILALAGFVLLDRLGRHQSEAATLRATDKLRREFIAFTAHELRNPVSAIITGASLLREPEIDTDLRQQVAESITRSTDALSRLVLNLLAMGRAEEGRLQLHRTAINLSSYIEDVVTELAVYHPGIEKRIHRHLPDVLLNADPEYLKLVIVNIVDNAVKYSPPRSPITVTAEIRGQMATVHIHNTGAGIPPEELPRIFEMYETTGTAPYSLRRGVGLGLYMARLLIESHGGTIWAESQPGEGATFSFTLPVTQIPPHETDGMSDVTE